MIVDPLADFFPEIFHDEVAHFKRLTKLDAILSLPAVLLPCSGRRDAVLPREKQEEGEMHTERQCAVTRVDPRAAVLMADCTTASTKIPLSQRMPCGDIESIRHAIEVSCRCASISAWLTTALSALPRPGAHRVFSPDGLGGAVQPVHTRLFRGSLLGLRAGCHLRPATRSPHTG